MAPGGRIQGSTAGGAIGIAALGALLSVLIIYPFNAAVIPALGNPGALLLTVPAERILTAAGLAWLAWTTPASISSKSAGLRLGAVAGLAFGLVETVIGGSGALGLLFSTPLHMIVAALVGIGVAFAAGRRLAGGTAVSAILLGRDTVSLLVIAIGCHLAYDLAASTTGLLGVLVGLALAGAVLFGIYRELPEDLRAASVTDPVSLLTAAFARVGGGLSAGTRAGGVALPLPGHTAGGVPVTAPQGPASSGARAPATAPAPGWAPSGVPAGPAPAGPAPAAPPVRRQVRFCSGCGAGVTAGDAFCARCGAPIESEAVR